MMTPTAGDALAARVAAGQVLTDGELQEAAATPDILALGMLADTARRARRGRTVTYLRVAEVEPGAAIDAAAVGGAAEVRLRGAYPGVAAAEAQLRQARPGAPGVSLVAWSLADIEAAGEGPLVETLRRLRNAGLDGVAEVPVDRVASAAGAVTALAGAGFAAIRLTVDKAAGDARVSLVAAFRAAAAAGPVAAVHPLPLMLNAFRPTTGYEDVRTIALARLALPGAVSVQVDWPRYGPKLAQVALSFGADDLYGAPAVDAQSEGWRRGALLEVTRNIEAAGFEPAERDAGFKARVSSAV